MAKKLKLSDSQICEIENYKQAQKDKNAANLAERKAKKEAELNKFEDDANKSSHLTK
jgi:hypothetical protein